MKFTSFLILNIVILTNVFAVKNKKRKNGGKVSTYGGNKTQQGQIQNKKIEEANKEVKLEQNNGVSTDNGVKQNGVESPGSPANTNSGDKSDKDAEILDSTKTSKSELDDASTIEELKNDATKDTTEATSLNGTQSPVLEDQEGKTPTNTPGNLNDENVSGLNTPTDHDDKTKKTSDDPNLPSDNLELFLEPETDNDTKKADPLIKHTSDQKALPLDDQKADKKKKIEDETVNSTKQSGVENKENPINTATVDQKPVEEALDKSKETTLKASTPSEIASDNSKSNNEEMSKDKTSSEVASDGNKGPTKKIGTPDSNVDHESKEDTNNSNPSTSETPDIISPPLPDDGKPKNNTIERNKKSNSSNLGKYLLWGLLGGCVVGLTVCMVLLVSSK